jgi:hypothetical protein
MQQLLHVRRQNSPGRQLVAISRFGQERLASQPFCGFLDGVLERQMLESVQRIVMDENADRPLRGQQVRQFIDDVGQRMQ